MINHNDSLVAELREARLKERAAFRGMLDARQPLRERQAEHQDALRLVEEILKEIETGSTGRPILDAIAGNGNGHPVDAHIERVNRLAGAETLADLEEAGPEVYAKAQEEFDGARGMIPPADVEALPDGGRPARELACEDLGHKRPWTDDELDRLLIHACRTYYPQTREWWEAATIHGALDDAIRDTLLRHWPQGRVFVGPDQTRQKHGYTITRAGSLPCLWVGAYKGPGHKATLAGSALIAAVRRVFDIADPTQGAPSAAEKPSRKPAKGRKPAEVASP